MNAPAVTRNLSRNRTCPAKSARRVICLYYSSATKLRGNSKSQISNSSRAVFKWLSIPKKLLQPITTEANSAMNQSELLVITSNFLKAREKSREQGSALLVLVLLFICWKTGATFKPITKRSNRYHDGKCEIHLHHKKKNNNCLLPAPSWFVQFWYPSRGLVRLQ